MTGAVKEWLRVELIKRGLDAELKQVRTQLVTLEDAAIEYLAEEGITSVKMNGSTVYMQTQTFASLAEDKDAAMVAFKEHGLGDLVRETVNSSSLAAFVREMRETEEGGIPDELEPHVTVSEVTRLRMRSS